MVVMFLHRIQRSLMVDLWLAMDSHKEHAIEQMATLLNVGYLQVYI